jgi:hypothetical protein
MWFWVIWDDAMKRSFPRTMSQLFESEQEGRGGLRMDGFGA